MEKGGYKIVDLKDINITTTPVKIAGVYHAIHGNSRKVILLSGITINGVQFSDEFVKVVKLGDDYLLNAYAVVSDNILTKYDIYIEDNDNVTLQLKTVIGSEIPIEGSQYFTVKVGAKKHGKL